jgi:hypothetical protein
MPPPVDAQRAMSFVRAHGPPRAKALLKVLLREPLGDAEISAVTQWQNSDGGFRAEEVAGNASLVGQTAAEVIHLCALGAQEFGTTQAAADFLLHRQRPDGRWWEDTSLGPDALPAYFRPGSADVEAWETAAACVALGALALPLDHQPATQWLAMRPCMRGDAAAFAVEPPLLYAVFHRAAQAGTHHADAARRAAHALDLRARDTWELPFAVMAMRLVGVPASDATVSAFCEALESRQAPDGGFADGGESDGLTTVYALAALDLALRLALPKRPPVEDGEPDLADAARAL